AWPGACHRHRGPGPAPTPVVSPGRCPCLLHPPSCVPLPCIRKPASLRPGMGPRHVPAAGCLGPGPATGLSWVAPSLHTGNHMRLQLCTWPEVEARLARSTGIIVPIGSTEQHGPNGLIGTDAICPEVVAQAAAERIDALVAPTLSVGMAQHHLAFPGTISLRPDTLIAVVRDVVQSLAGHGFREIYFLNGHGGNIATVQAAFAQFNAEASFARRDEPAPRLKIASWFAG